MGPGIPPSRRAVLTALGAVTASAGVGACSGGSDADAPTPRPSPRAVTDVVTGLKAPWSVTWAGGAPLLSQRDDARIRQLIDGELREVCTVPGVRHGGEGGLLGMAVQGRWLTVYYTGSDDANHVERYRWSKSSGAIRLSGRRRILDGIPAGEVHDGGRIAFGPDGKLYVAVGDTTQSALAQDKESLAGKILWMDPDGGVPAGNPFARSRVWSMGHRNVQGMAWAADRTMFAVEFGDSTWDELNVIVPGGNYGWPVHEGRSNDTKYRNPVQQWPTSDASPSGMTIHGGTIYVACLRGERLLAVPVSDPARSRSSFVGTYGRLRDVAVAPDGSLWVLTNNTDGRGEPKPGDDRILRVEPSAISSR